ncbi:MAG: GNAT family N-acetyltransferase [Elusimicrobia bacterium]|nr:GNAT family N-acetyltransferase [Elusimicrobiota bacterium]
MELELSALSSVSDGQRAAFYARMFPERADLLSKHWRWWYRVGFLPGVEPIVAVDKGAVVGQAGLLPVMLDCRGEAKPAIWFVDFAVLPELQGQGLGQRLTNAWMQLCPNRVTYCNEQSIRVFKKYGWKEKFDTVCRTLPIHIGKTAAALLSLPYRAMLRAWFASAPQLSPEPLPEDIGRLRGILQAGPDAAVSVVRDEAWIRWRLLENPFKDSFRLFSLKDSYAIVRGFVYQGQKRVHVLYMDRAAEPDARGQLLRGILRWAVRQGADMAWTATNERPLLEAAALVLPRSRPVRFASHSEDAVTRSALLDEHLPLQAIDSDNDLMFAPDSGSGYPW